MAREEQTSVTLKAATVKSVSMRKGELVIVVSAPADEASATTAELNDLTSGTFKGTVTIRGKQQQQLELQIPDKAPKE